MKQSIPKKFRYAKRRKIIKQGSSLVLTIPVHLIETEGINVGDIIKIYSDGNGLILVDLRPEGE